MNHNNIKVKVILKSVGPGWNIIFVLICTSSRGSL